MTEQSEVLSLAVEIESLLLKTDGRTALAALKVAGVLIDQRVEVERSQLFDSFPASQEHQRSV